jgi:hypothetical protein
LFSSLYVSIFCSHSDLDVCTNEGECLAPFVGYLLSPPDKVVRSDGQKVKTAEKVRTIQELKEVLKILIRKDFLLMYAVHFLLSYQPRIHAHTESRLPFFFYVTFLLSYAGSYLTLYFSVRARALASLISALGQITANFFFGTFLDWQRLTLNQRARYSYIFMMALFGGTWIWGTVIQHEYGLTPPKLDWADSGFGRGWAFYILMQVNLCVSPHLFLALISSLGSMCAVLTDWIQCPCI